MLEDEHTSCASSSLISDIPDIIKQKFWSFYWTTYFHVQIYTRLTERCY